MSGRDPLLRGFEDNHSHLGHIKAMALRCHIRNSSALISCAFGLGIPDCVIFNALMLSEDFLRQKPSTLPFITPDMILKIALRYSVFYRQRSDVLSHLMADVCQKSYSVDSKLISRTESELLNFCKCRVWFTKGNIFEGLRTLIESFTNFSHRERLWDVSTAICWILLDSGLIGNFEGTSSICIAVLACSIALLCKCRVVNEVVDRLLEAARIHLVVEVSGDKIQELTHKLLTYIVDYSTIHRVLVH